MKKFISLVVLGLFSTVAYSQPKNILEQMKEHDVFQHLDASVTLGTTGIGVDITSPIGNYVNLRAGFDFMPHFHHNMSFDIQVGETKDESKFNRLAGMLEDFTGYKVDDQVNMIGKPTYSNFKLLVDVFPMIDNKHWHVTAGFYWGKSRIAEAYNTTADMPSLMAVGIYNNIYDRVMAGEPVINGEYLPYEMEAKIRNYGRMGIHVGDHKESGSAYMMEPEATTGMVKAHVKVNSFKPYLGIGYGGRLLKNTDKYHVAVDCGMLFWGGTPSIITHDGTDLAKDVDDIGGKVGDYVDLLKGFKVFPVLNVRFVRSIF